MRDPFDLASLEAAAVEHLMTSFENCLEVRDFWRAVRLNTAMASSAEHLFLAAGKVGTAAFRRAIKRHRKELSRTDTAAPASSPGMRLPPNYPMMGHMARTRAIREANHSPSWADGFIQDRTQANLLKQVRGSLPAIGSALNCFASFCELRGGGHPFPPSEQLIIEWSSFFADTATFANYISNMQKACFAIGFSTDWMTPVARRLPKGLKKCQDTCFRFPNFIRSRLLLRITRHEGCQSEFPHACWMSLLCAFRVPSETLCLARAFRNDANDALPSHREKALIGVREEQGAQFSIDKMKWLHLAHAGLLRG